MRPAAFELCFQRRIERLVGGIAVGEQRVAAVGRDLDRIQQGPGVGNLRVNLVVMEVHLAVGQCPDGLAVLTDVGDHHDVGMHAIIPGRTELGRTRQRSEFAEIAGHADLVVLRELLAAEHQDRMIEPSLANLRDDIRFEHLAQINAADFGADVPGQRNHLEPGFGRDGHGVPRWAWAQLF